MIIEYRGIYHDRFDAPFGMGSLIWAKDCHHHCAGCFHQDRFGLPILRSTAKEILSEVINNSFSQGIVMGGFEWLEQYDQALELIREAQTLGLSVILYTHYTSDDLKSHYSELLHYKGLYVKCGEYDETLLNSSYTSYGVHLASTNQKIYKIGVDL